MKEKKLIWFIGRKEVLGAFLILFLLFAFYSVKFMSASPYVVKTQKLGTFSDMGELRHSAYLKPNEIYGYLISRDEYPISLVDRFLLNYTYRSNPPLSTGTYEVTGKVTYYVTRGSKDVTLWEETLFDERGKLQNGGFTVERKLDMGGKIEEMSGNVSRELGMTRLKRRITVTVKASGTGEVGGKAVNEKFDHEVELVRDGGGAGLYYFTNTEKTTRKPLTATSREEVSASVLGVTGDLNTAKVVTTLMALLMLIPVVGYAYTSRPPKDEMARIKRYMVNGVPGQVQKRVVLKTPKDLETAFELLDRPVLHYVDDNEEVFAIIDEGGVSYEYRKPLPGKRNEPN